MTRETADDERVHHLIALGGFIETFAMTELALFFYYCHCAKVDAQTGSVLFSGVGVDQTIRNIRKLWTVQPAAEKERAGVEAALKQLESLRAFRNAIVHFLPLPGDSGRLVTDFAKIPPSKAPTEHSVSAEILDHATADLAKIAQHLAMAIGTPEETRVDRVAAYSALDDAWRYTPQPYRPPSETPPEVRPHTRGNR